MSKFIKNVSQDNQLIIERDTKKKIKKPSLYKVVMLNDDYTPMDFVVYLLKFFFHKNHTEASKIMLKVHNKGACLCGIYSFEVAESKILEVIITSRKNGFPLLCTLEKI
jgi:ATP-dependent Clp protease adaptor protein ClpS